MVKRMVDLSGLKPEEATLAPRYSRRALTEPVPRYEMPLNEMDSQSAYTLIHDELMLDGNAWLNLATFGLNLATFVTTWMEPEAEKPTARAPQFAH
jgi:glutamate decarboxylase